uniref:hypothetical protein n=1 Tax=Paenarthrobacter nicotinovorans TaxID=29320 RepID=UPI003F499388
MFGSDHVDSTSEGKLLRVQEEDDGPLHIGELRSPARGALIILTVLPQRTVSKYHHRAGPLLIADTAYAAVALVHHAAALEVTAGWSALAPQRWPGPIPEFTLAQVLLGTAPTGVGNKREDNLAGRIAGVTQAQLATRRSADVSDSRANAGRTAEDADTAVQRLLHESITTFTESRPPSSRIRVLTGDSLLSPLLANRCAGQHWVRKLRALVVFETSITPTHEAIWWSSTLAAHILYTALGTDTALDFRPVGGWTGTDGGWTTLHGLGIVLRDPTDRSKERPVDAGQ